jgi:uncharacterized protein (TIGR00251 family)
MDTKLLKLTIHAKPNSKKEGIQKISEQEWIVRVRAQAIDGKANQAIVESVSEESGVPKSKVKIVSGETSKKKILEIQE